MDLAVGCRDFLQYAGVVMTARGKGLAELSLLASGGSDCEERGQLLPLAVAQARTQCLSGHGLNKPSCIWSARASSNRKSQSRRLSKDWARLKNVSLRQSFPNFYYLLLLVTVHSGSSWSAQNLRAVWAICSCLRK